MAAIVAAARAIDDAEAEGTRGGGSINCGKC